MARTTWSFRRASSALFLLPWVAFVGLCVGCAHSPGKLQYADDPSVHPDLDVSVAYLENKGDHVNMRLMFRNKSKYPLTYTGSSVRFLFDGRPSVQPDPFLRTLGPGESEARQFTFQFEPSILRTGIATLIVEPLYKGGAGDEKARQETKRYYRRFEVY